MAWLGLCLAACDDAAPPAAAEVPVCGTEGRLHAEIYGSFRASIDWDAHSLECAGMPRPEGAGARLRFAGTTADGRSLAFILGLPDLMEGESGSELPTNVTVIEEGAGRFFGSRGANTCWSDIEVHELLPSTESAVYRIAGILYCVAPLADINGNSSISLTELQFSGRLDWAAP